MNARLRIVGKRGGRADTPGLEHIGGDGRQHADVRHGAELQYMHINHIKAISILFREFIQYCVIASANRLRHSKCLLFSAQKPNYSLISFELAVISQFYAPSLRLPFQFLSCHRTIDFNLCSPVLGDVKAPLEFQMLVLVVINKGGDGGVVASGKHAGWCVFLSNYS